MIYHYTSIDSLHKILGTDNDKICIRATHAGFMNDPHEYEYANSIITESLIEYEKRKEIKEKKSVDLIREGFFEGFAHIAGEPFILSFSEHSDDLSMWRAYGQGGNGVCIGFDINMLREFESTNTGLVKCNYNKDSFLDIMFKYFDKEYVNFIISKNNNGQIGIEFNDLNLFFSMSRLGFTAKCRSYEGEKEWRLCTNIGDYRFKVNGNLIVPFIEHHFKKEIIKKIIIGPCLNCSDVKKGLELFLEKYKFPYNNSFIENSNISYRQL